MDCSVIGCEETAVAIYQHTPVRLHWGEEIYIDLALCLNCEHDYADEDWMGRQWPLGLSVDHPANSTN